MNEDIVCFQCYEKEKFYNYFCDGFRVRFIDADEQIKDVNYRCEYILNFSDSFLKKAISIQKIRQSEYTPIFIYLYDKGFRIKGEMAKAIFKSYILREIYCKNILDFEILYEAVCIVVRFSETIQLWDANYRMYDGLKERLALEIDNMNWDI